MRTDRSKSGSWKSAPKSASSRWQTNLERRQPRLACRQEAHSRAPCTAGALAYRCPAPLLRLRFATVNRTDGDYESVSIRLSSIRTADLMMAVNQIGRAGLYKGRVGLPILRELDRRLPLDLGVQLH